uniref:Uncharacterized protein n=1 Tax=Oryza glumipatula TaxID=40148 RepID=A0A0E0B0T1_9ORYZ
MPLCAWDVGMFSMHILQKRNDMVGTDGAIAEEEQEDFTMLATRVRAAAASPAGAAEEDGHSALGEERRTASSLHVFTSHLNPTFDYMEDGGGPAFAVGASRRLSLKEGGEGRGKSREGEEVGGGWGSSPVLLTPSR